LIFFFIFYDTAPTAIYTLSLHDALPISAGWRCGRDRRTGHERRGRRGPARRGCRGSRSVVVAAPVGWQSRRWPGSDRAGRERRRSEEHTSELQSLAYLVCRLLLEKKKKI